MGGGSEISGDVSRAFYGPQVLTSEYLHPVTPPGFFALLDCTQHWGLVFTVQRLPTAQEEDRLQHEAHFTGGETAIGADFWATGQEGYGLKQCASLACSFLTTRLPCFLLEDGCGGGLETGAPTPRVLGRLVD